jgi:hypothetical protein
MGFEESRDRPAATIRLGASTRERRVPGIVG